MADAVPAGRRVNFSIPLAAAFLGAVRGPRLRAHRPIAPGATSLVGATAATAVQRPRVGNDRGVAGRQRRVDSRRQGDDRIGSAAGRVRPMELPPRQQEPLFYRNEASNEPMPCSSPSLRRHAQQIGVDVASRLDVDEQGGQWKKSCPTRSPMSRPIICSSRFPQPDCSRPTGVVRRRPASRGRNLAGKPRPQRCGCGLALPKACIGGCQLTARYRLRVQKPPSADHTLVTVPLLMPASEAKEVNLPRTSFGEGGGRAARGSRRRSVDCGGRYRPRNDRPGRAACN